MSKSNEFQSIDKYFSTILKFKCTICDKETTNRDSIRSHIKTDHESVTSDLSVNIDKNCKEISFTKKDDLYAFSKSEQLLEKLNTAIRKLDGSLRQGYEIAKRKSRPTIEDIEYSKNEEIVEMEYINDEDYVRNF